MQTSALNGVRVTPYCTSSGNLKRFRSLAALCYHPTMLSNQSHGARRSCFKAGGFAVCGDTLERGFLLQTSGSIPWVSVPSPCEAFYAEI